MLQSVEDSRHFLIRYLWTGFVLLLVIGGLVVALARGNLHGRGIQGATLAEHSSPWTR